MDQSATIKLLCGLDANQLSSYLSQHVSSDEEASIIMTRSEASEDLPADVLETLRKINEDKLQCDQRGSAFDSLFASVLECGKSGLDTYRACIRGAGEEGVQVSLQSMMAPMVAMKETIDTQSAEAQKRLVDASEEARLILERDLCKDVHELVGNMIAARLDLNPGNRHMYKVGSAWLQAYVFGSKQEDNIERDV